MLDQLPRKLREARGRTSQAKFAESVGVSPHAIYLFERGSDPAGKPMRPSLETLARIAEVSGRSMAWFFEAESSPEPTQATVVEAPAAEASDLDAAQSAGVRDLLAQLVAQQAQVLEKQTQMLEQLVAQTERIERLDQSRVEMRSQFHHLRQEVRGQRQAQRRVHEAKYLGHPEHTRRPPTPADAEVEGG